jgi:hypothetical protein
MKACYCGGAWRIKTMRAVAVLFVILSSVGQGHLFGAERAAKTPVLIELFTSEGCSSCPPADTFVEKLEATQPIPGEQVIVLSEHVDYWDHDGWKDPFSSHSLTDRQEDYVHALGLSTAYTPQIIVDGTGELHLESPQQVEQTFQKAGDGAKIPVQISSLGVDNSSPAMLRAHIEVDGEQAPKNAEVYLAVALGHAESQVLRGENKGQHLGYVDVVQSLTKLGVMEKGQRFSKDVSIKLKDGTDPANIRVVAFVQETGPGGVLGAALQNVGMNKN